MTALKRAAERGCEIVSINPLAEAALVRFRHPQEPEDLLGEGTAIATLHLPVRIGGDAAPLQGIMKRSWPRLKSPAQPAPRRSSTTTSSPSTQAALPS